MIKRHSVTLKRINKRLIVYQRRQEIANSK